MISGLLTYKWLNGCLFGSLFFSPQSYPFLSASVFMNRDQIAMINSECVLIRDILEDSMTNGYLFGTVFNLS